MFLDDKGKAISAFGLTAALVCPLAPLAQLCSALYHWGNSSVFPAPSPWLEQQHSGNTGVPTVVQVTDVVAVPLTLPGAAAVPPLQPSRGAEPGPWGRLLRCQCSYAGTPCSSLRRSTIPTRSIPRYADVYLAKARAGSLNFQYSLFVILYLEKFQLIHSGSRKSAVGLGGPGTHRTAASAWDSLHLGEARGEVCARRHPHAAPSVTHGKEPRLK